MWRKTFKSSSAINLMRFQKFQEKVVVITATGALFR